MTETVTARVPQWDVADRMRKALRESGVGVLEIAEYLGVSRNGVSAWVNGRTRPSTQTLRLWALRCGVPYEWLVTGEWCARPDSNGRPSDYLSDKSALCIVSLPWVA